MLKSKHYEMPSGDVVCVVMKDEDVDTLRESFGEEWDEAKATQIIEGIAVEFYGSKGIVTDKPLTRDLKDYDYID